jgi:hypothetical protein
MGNSETLAKFKNILIAVVADGSFVKLSLGNYQGTKRS